MLDFAKILEREETLDPENWDAMKQLGYRMVDEMMDYLRTLGERPAWQQPTDTMKAALAQPLPQSAEPIDAVYEDFKNYVLPFNKGNAHPRFWSWVEGNGTPFAMLAEMLAAGMNPNLGIGDHAAVYVEYQVLDWCKEMLGYPKTASGQLVSGGSVANITGLLTARNAFANDLIRKQGLQALPGKMRVYASSETHNCNYKAIEIAGLGSKAIRTVRVDENYRLDINHLRELIAEDRAAGNLPWCVIGNAGTVNTGAIDPLDEMLAICKAENLWFHVDGAFGALAKLVPEYQSVLKAIEEADSVAFDLHKWMYLPYEAGCILVKNKEIHRDAFAMEANYLLNHERGLAAGPEPISKFGLQLSRGFKALKVWMSFKEQGIEKFARLIRQNIAQAFYLGDLVENTPQLELLTPVAMNIVCFRFNPGNLDQAQLNHLNKEILMRLHEQGIATPSYTLLRGNYAIRCAIVNHRSRKSDFELLVESVVRIGNEVAAIGAA